MQLRIIDKSNNKILATYDIADDGHPLGRLTRLKTVLQKQFNPKYFTLRVTL
jgi:hypothetical protein